MLSNLYVRLLSLILLLDFALCEDVVRSRPPVIDGESVTLQCPTSDKNSVNWWYRKTLADHVTEVCVNGQVINGHRRRMTVNPTDKYSLTIQSTRMSDTGIFTCVENDGFGRRHSIYLQVIERPIKETTAVVGKSVTLICEFPSIILPVNWRFQTSEGTVEKEVTVDGVLINGYSRGRFKVDGPNLVISVVRFEDEGVYSCIDDIGLGRRLKMRLIVSADNSPVEPRTTISEIAKLTAQQAKIEPTTTALTNPSDSNIYNDCDDSYNIHVLATVISALLGVVIGLLIYAVVVNRNRLKIFFRRCFNRCLSLRHRPNDENVPLNLAVSEKEYWKNLLESIDKMHPTANIDSHHMSKMASLWRYPEIYDKYIEKIAARVRSHSANAIVGFNSHIGLAVAARLGMPYILVDVVDPSVPSSGTDVVKEVFESTQGEEKILQLSRDTSLAKWKVILIDNSIDTNTLSATVRLLEKVAMEVVECAVIVKILDDMQSKVHKDDTTVPVFSLCHYSHPNGQV